MTDLFSVAPFGSASPAGSPVPESLSDNLRLAASRGQVQAVKDLLAAGAGLHPDKDGRNGLHYAAQEGHAEVCKYLAAHGCDVNMQDVMGYTPLLRAASQGAKDVVQMLLDAGCRTDMQDEHGNAAIHESCWNGFSQTAELLIKYSCNVCLTNKAGFTALHLAAQNGHNECSRVLLYAGCNPDLRNNYGDTALHTAARYGHAGVARILISARCKLSEQNKNGDTALHISSALKRRKIAKILVESGIDTELLNKQNERAVDVARRKEHPEIILIITSYSKPRASSHRHKGEHFGVTFKEVVDFEDRLEATQVDESIQKHEPKADKQEKERRFFFFKKKKKDKEKAPSTPVASNKKPETEHSRSDHGKPAVHGFFSQYVPRDGVQLYRDLAGNVKQGPIGYAPVCQCGPSLRRLENSITDTRESLHNHIDASHHMLSQRIDTIDVQTKQQAHSTEAMVHDRFNSERIACNTRISEHLQDERLETKAMFDQVNVGMKDELEYWLNDKLASYGHCLDHHHDDSALPPRNLFFDFPTMGRLVRSRSDETLSASDYSGKFRKKDFYASRQAAMQQIRGWDVPTTDNFSNHDRSRKKERNNNVVPKTNRVVTHAQVHSREPEKTRNFSPTTNLTTSSSGGLTTSQNARTVLSAGQNVSKTEHFGTMGRSGNLPWKQTIHEMPQGDYLKKAISQPRVTFSSDQQKQHAQQPHQHVQQPHQRSGFSSPTSVSSPRSTTSPANLRRQSLRNSSRGTSPAPQSNIRQQVAPASQHPWWSQQNLLEGGPLNTDMKSGELGDSRISSLTGQQRNYLTRNTRQQNVDQIQCQDGYGIHRDQPRTLSADSLLNEETHLSYSKHVERCHSVENTLDCNDTNRTDIYNSGYFTDSAVRPSSGGSNSKNIGGSRSIRSTQSASPASRTTYRYRLPETSVSPDHTQPESYAISALDSSQKDNTNIPSRQISSREQSPTNVNTFLNKTLDSGRKTVPSKLLDTPGEFIYSKTLHKSLYGLSDTSGSGFTTFGKHEPVTYPEKSNPVSRSEGNLTSETHSVHFKSQGKECLQHESLVPSNTVPSPAYAAGNKEDSTCSSTQDSGYGSRNHGGGLRRGVDTSGGTPSSSFSMERSSCNTPSNTDSPYTTHGDLPSMEARTFRIDHSSAAAVYDNKYQVSPNALLINNAQGLPGGLRNNPPIRGSSCEKSVYDFSETYHVNSNSSVPFGNESLEIGLTKSIDSVDQGSSFYNRPSQMLRPSLSSKPHLQQRLIPQASNGNRFSYVGQGNTMHLAAEKQLQCDKIKNNEGTSERQGLVYHVDVNKRPSFHQNSFNDHTVSDGRDGHVSSPQAHTEPIYKPVLPAPSLKQTSIQVTTGNYSYNTSQSRASYSQQHNQGNMPQVAVQAHIQGWYQRKLMEAAQRLRQSQDDSQQNFEHYDTRDGTDYHPRKDTFSRANEFASYSYNSQQSYGASSQHKSPASNVPSLGSTRYGANPQPHQNQFSGQNSTHESSYGEYQLPNQRERFESEGVISQQKDRDLRTSMHERRFSGNNSIFHPPPVDHPYYQKGHIGSTYPSSMHVMSHNVIHYDSVRGSDV